MARRDGACAAVYLQSEDSWLLKKLQWLSFFEREGLRFYERLSKWKGNHGFLRSVLCQIARKRREVDGVMGVCYDRPVVLWSWVFP
jgi:hypothetical protein